MKITGATELIKVILLELRHIFEKMRKVKNFKASSAPVSFIYGELCTHNLSYCADDVLQ